MSYLKPILLVEDDPNDRKLILKAFMDSNIANDVHIAVDGEEALNYLYQKEKFVDRVSEDPVVILLDIKMPKVDGLEVLEQIKNDENLRLIPVIMLTSSEQDEDIIRSYKLGVNAYVVKPVDFADFVNAVRDLGVFWALLNKTP